MNEVGTLVAQWWPYIAGVCVIALYAGKRFSDPTFPNSNLMPSAIDPIRYLFLGPQYGRAIALYIALISALYIVVTKMGDTLFASTGWDKIVSVQSIPLMVALFIVGVFPVGDDTRFIFDVEKRIRRFVHLRYLVPTRTEQTITLLDNVNNRRYHIGVATGSLDEMWSRACAFSLIVADIRQNKFQKVDQASFVPFANDAKAIEDLFKNLGLQVETNKNSVQRDEIRSQIAGLNIRQSALLSWIVNYKARSEGDMYDKLAELGFDIPKTTSPKLFDVIFPGVLIATVVSALHSVLSDFIVLGSSGELRSIKDAALAAVANGLMYYSIIHIALQGRSDQIKQSRWRRTSSLSLCRIAILAGLSAWIIIAISTIAFRLSLSIDSLQAFGVDNAGIVDKISNALLFDGKVKKPNPGLWGINGPPWITPWLQGLMAFPWVLAGAALAAVTAFRIEGDPRRIIPLDRLRDGMVFGAIFAISSIAAGLTQQAFIAAVKTSSVNLFTSSVTTGCAAFFCGFFIGLFVPCAYKRNILAPEERVGAFHYYRVREKAEDLLGRDAGLNWVCKPQVDELQGLCPAEAIQYSELVTKVENILNSCDNSNKDGLEDKSSVPASVVVVAPSFSDSGS